MTEIPSLSWINNICRTCLIYRKREIFNITQTKFKNVELTAILDYFAAVMKFEISESNNLPLNMCTSCIKSFYNSYTFLKACENAQTDLKLRLSVLASKHNDELLQITLKDELITLDGDGEQYPAVLIFPPDEDKAEPDITNNTVAMIIEDDSCESDIEERNDLLIDSGFNRNANLTEHERKHTGEQVVCSLCGEGFNSSASLYTHEQQQHKIKQEIICIKNEEEPSDGYTADIPNDDAVRKDDFKCQICAKLLSSKSKLKDHMLLHGPKSFQCKKCNKSYINQKTLNLHMKSVHEGITFPCAKCDKVYKRKNDLSSHMKTHRIKISFRCGKCPKQFLHRTSLRDHQRLHEGDTTYQCKECSYICINRRGLESHERTHTGERPFSCNNCDRTFTQKTRLNEHMRTHTGEKSHKCTVCPAEFHTARNLREHSKIHVTVDEVEMGSKMLIGYIV